MRKSIIGIIRIDKFSQVSLALFVLISAFAFIHVLPVHAGPISLGVAPSTAVVGTTVTATGAGATADGEVRLYIGSVLLARALTSTTADGAGTYSVQFIVPPVARGSQVIVASDLKSGNTAIAFLTVAPRILVTPTVGSFNETISVRGEGFAASKSITLWLEGRNVTSAPTPSTDSFGTFETSFQMPSMPNGTYTFSAVDRDGNAAKTLITVVPKIFVQPTSGAPNTFVLVYGYGFSNSTGLKLFFDSIDVTPFGSTLTSPEGAFITSFFVPNASDGVHSISAYDNVGNAANCPFAVPSPIMMLAPETISESSMVTVEGIGFQPDAPVVLYMEDTVTTSIYDLVARTENIVPKTNGSFQYSFMVPITGAGTYEVAAYQSLGPLPSDLYKVASATLTIMERASLDADITTGTIHFRGEMAEFYLKTALKGKPIDVEINDATVYSANGSCKQDLTSNVTQISPGLYIIPYAIQDNASFGTYALLVNISLHTDLLEAYGSATGSFMISPLFTTQAAQLLDIQNSIATVIIPDLGTVKANLSTINAKLVSIKDNVAIIQSDIGTLKTSVDSINATLVSIDGNTATVESELGTIRTTTDAIHATVTSINGDVATVSSDLGTVKVKMAESGNQSNVAALFAVAAAVAASGSAVILYRRKPPEPPTESSTSPPTEAPTPQSAPTPTQSEKQEQTQTQIETPAEAPKPTEVPPQETPAEAPKPTEAPPQETPPPAEPPAEPSPQTQSPADSTTSKESPPQIQPEPQPQPQTVVVQPEQPIPQ